MKLFVKQTKPVGNITLMAIFAAILASFSLFMAFVPFASFVLAFFLPLISAMVAYFVEPKYLPIYIIGSIALCLGVSFFNIGDTVFIVIPSVFSGCFYGLLRSKRIPSQMLVALTAVLQFILNILAFFILQTITGVDVIDVALKLVGFSESAHIRDIVPAFILAYSFAESVVNLLVIEIVTSKFSKDSFDMPYERFLSPILGFAFGALSILFAFIYSPVAYVSLFASIFFSFVGSHLLLEKRPIWVYVLLVILLIASLFMYALFNQFFHEGTELNLTSVFSMSIAFTSFVSIFENKGVKI